MSRYDVVILGGGAAGLFCAIQAGKRGRRVLVLERAERLGKKILISGGGRCNFTNARSRPENFSSTNPHFCKSALARFSPADFVELVERHRIEYYEKKLGQLFCKHSAKEIVAMLARECSAAGVEIRLKQELLSVEKNGLFRLETVAGPLEAESFVVATGGLSYPKLGATPFGYELAKRFGHAVHPCRPALVPFLVEEKDRAWTELSGVSTEIVVSAKGKSFRESLLFTHRGLSGPAILQISSYWKSGEAIAIDLLPDEDAGFLLRLKKAGEKAELKNLLARHLPQRLAETWCSRHAPSRPLQDWTDRDLSRAGELLKRWELKPAGTEGYDTAEVTAGGVDTAELSSKTLESTRVPGLYFIGEVLDVTGELGGFNFQWAWASGFAAGQVV
ncbi:MAG TPA: NAD(P)/FAD-dependent oxidoreductase [bacterium]|nr:NAD(P)/FAD-dependent oxidoreductase [bacterium]